MHQSTMLIAPINNVLSKHVGSERNVPLTVPLTVVVSTNNDDISLLIV